MPTSRKVRFIEPSGRPGRPLNVFIRRFPLLGPILLATILHERGYDVSVYNENISGPVDENPDAYRDVCSADVVGISIMTSAANRGYAIADRIRRDSPGVKIVFGGVHATFMPQEALVHGDIVVSGEGEGVIEPIARGEITSGVVRAAPVEDLDSLPTLNHFLMRDFDRLLAGYPRRDMYELPVMTSRGCPYGCTYCSVSRMFGRKVRRRSVDKVCADLCRYVDQGFRFLFFYDDNFTSDREWTRTLLERIRPMRVRFNAQSRVDFYWMDAARRRRDDALLRAMRRGGCNALLLGYETMDDATAAEWEKGYRGERSLESRLAEDTRILHDSGIWVYAMFVMGPRDTARTADRIVRFARRCQIESLQISILTPFPGTPLMDQMRPHLLLDRFPSDWDYYDATHCVYDHGRLGVEEMHRVVLDAFRRFYRFGGWKVRALRSIAARPIPASDKLLDLARRIHTNMGIFRMWRQESEEYFRVVRSRAHT